MLFDQPDPALPVPRTAGPASGLLWLAVPVLSTLLVLAVVANLGVLLVLALVAALALVASLCEIRVAYLVGVLLASFVNTGGGRLALELGIVYGWIAWTALLTVWRGRWLPLVMPPRGAAAAILVWTAVCGLGGLLGVGAGNNLRYLGLELAGAGWPVLALFVCQVQSRKTLPLAALGLLLISLAHVPFGLIWMKLAGQRLGGVFFTTLPGFTAVGLWAVGLLAPQPRVRGLAYALLVPLLTHQFFSFTRGYWLGILAGFAVVTLLVLWGAPRAAVRLSLRRVGSLAAVLLVVAGTVFASTLYFGQGGLIEAAGRRFQSAFSLQPGGETASNLMRLLEYSQAIDAAKQSPVTGRGWGFLITERDPLTGQRFTAGVVHNYYLFLWLKLGVVGLVAFLFLVWRFLATTLRRARREPAWQARAWLIAAVAITVQALVICLTNYSLNDYSTGVYMAFLWGTALALQAEPPAAPAAPGGA